LRIPAAETFFAEPWGVAARRMIPNSSPQVAATLLWGPVLGWCTLQLLAESINADAPERVAVDLFESLRLREPFAQAFQALGFAREDGWRAAARIKVVLLAGAEQAADALAAVSEDPEKLEEAAGESVSPDLAGGERVALAPGLWRDPDVRWLAGVHAASDGTEYLVREAYEELLWWLQTPALLRRGPDVKANRETAKQVGLIIEDALATAEAAGYRIDVLMPPAPNPVADDAPSVEELEEADGEVEADVPLPMDLKVEIEDPSAAEEVATKQVVPDLEEPAP
jgi:hypothetical protein